MICLFSRHPPTPSALHICKSAWNTVDSQKGINKCLDKQMNFWVYEEIQLCKFRKIPSLGSALNPGFFPYLPNLKLANTHLGLQTDLSNSCGFSGFLFKRQGLDKRALRLLQALGG